MAFPSTTFRSELDPTVAKEIDALSSVMTGFLSNQHNADGSHGEVVADRLTTPVLMIPTTNPRVVGALWNNAGTLTISAG